MTYHISLLFILVLNSFNVYTLKGGYLTNFGIDKNVQETVSVPNSTLEAGSNNYTGVNVELLYVIILSMMLFSVIVVVALIIYQKSAYCNYYLGMNKKMEKTESANENKTLSMQKFTPVPFVNITESNAHIYTLSLIASTTANSVIITDEHGYIEWVNDAFTRNTEYSLVEAVGKTPCELLLGPNSSKVSFQDINAKLKHKNSFSFDTLNYKKSGNSFYALINVQPLLQDDGSITKYFAIINDISHLKNSCSSKELNSETTDYISIFKNSKPCIVCNSELEIININAAAELLLFEAYNGFDFSDITWILGISRQELDQKLRGISVNKTIYLESQILNFRKDTIWLNIEITLLESQNYLIKIENSSHLKIKEQELENLKLQFNAILEGHRDIDVYAVDEHGILLFCNNAFKEKIQKRLNISVEKGMHFLEFIPNQYRDLALDIFKSALLKKELYFESELEVEDKKFFIAYNIHHIQDPNKNTKCLLYFLHDITSKKKAENALSEIEERFATFMEHNPATAWLKDASGRHVFINKKFAQQFATSLPEIKGKTDFELHPHSVAIRTDAEDKKVLEGKTSVEYFEKVPAPDGSIRYWHIYKFPVYNSTGEVLIGGIAFDVTDIKNDQKALEESERKYRLISENIRDVICLLDAEGYYKYISPSVCNWGYTAEELINKTAFDIMHPEDEALLKQYYKEGNPSKTIQYRIRKKTGEYIWVETQLEQIKNPIDNSKQIQSLTRDVTERKQIENAIRDYAHNLEKANTELRKAKENAEQSARIKEEFLANMSHEIRTPMNAIIGLTNVLLNTEISQEQYEYLQAIEHSGETLMVIINDILDFSKIEAGKMIFENINFSLRDSIKFINELLKAKAAEKNLTLEYEVLPNVHDRLIGDPIRLNQILLNLISNAIKFTEKGGVKLTVETSENRENEVEVTFKISDTGIGIAEENLQDIFNSFTQATNQTSRRYGGTGLGLTIVKRLVELQNGSIHVISTPNVGSTFTVKLWFAKDFQTHPLKSQNINRKALTQSFAGKTALLVEDNALNQLVAKKVLTDFGLIVTTADNGRIAVDKLKTQDFDIILMDVQMPEMDGHEATQYIRKYLPSPKNKVSILAMTAHAVKGEIDKCLESGMNDFISKPFDAKNLHAKIKKLLATPNDNTNIMKTEAKDDSPAKLVNLERLIDLSEGSWEFVEEMVQMFINTIPTNLKEMQSHLERSDWKQLQLLAHKSRPSYGFMGMKEAEVAMKNIEKITAELPDPSRLKLLIKEATEITNLGLIELQEELKQIKLN